MALKSLRQRRPARPLRSRRPRFQDLPAPSELEAYTFEVEGDEYAVFAFPLPDVDVPADLTLAEQEVVRAVLEGRSNAEIAKARGTSPNTVANQLRSIYAKLGVSSRLELIRRCMGARPGRRMPRNRP